MNQNKIYTPYYRVSTKEQGNSGLGFAAQKSDVLRFVNQDTERLKGVFKEVESGNNNEREELQKAIDFCKRYGTTLLVAKLDRLSRNAAFIFKLRDEQVDFVCCDLPEANTLTIGIFATLAQYERELISKRTKSALAELKKKGVKLGSPQNLTDEARRKGARANKKKAYSRPNNRRARGYIKNLRQEGLTFQAIADRLNTEEFKSPKGKQFTRATAQRIFIQSTRNQK